MKKIFCSLAAASMLALVAAGHASAGAITVTGMEFANPTAVHIRSATPAVQDYVHAGSFLAKSGEDLFRVWCVDLFKPTQFGQVVQDYTLQSGMSVLGAEKTDLLGRLATYSLGLVRDATTSSAFQLAIWEILGEGVGTKYNVASGNFSSYGASDDSMSMAMEWLNQLPAVSRYTVDVYKSATRQNLAVFNLVPEPSMLLMFGSGLLGIAALQRRRQRVR